MNFLERAHDGQNQFWKYLIVVVVGFFGGQIVGSIPLAVVILSNIVQSGEIPAEITMDFTTLGISKNVGFVLIMLPFVASFFLTVLLVKLLHRRSFSEVVNGTRRFRIRHGLEGLVVWFAVLGLYQIFDYLIDGGNYTLQFDAAKFGILLLVSVIFIPFQSGYEEYLMRGYLAQGIVAATKSRWLAILIPGILFGLLHLANPEVKEFGFLPAMSQYIFFGLIFGIVSVLDDGIELAMGMHVANNILLSLFVTHEASALQTDSMFRVHEVNPYRELTGLVVVGMLVVLFFARRYGWDFRILGRKV
ncbi:MAG: CPBP family intramembrane metalloprotease [Tannerella sp.]|jgi:membrane protease YdiL (CAAX protease family)|nr:CPBP family intramembrane metalloprotease [Tannerella sp.]